MKLATTASAAIAALALAACASAPSSGDGAYNDAADSGAVAAPDVPDTDIHIGRLSRDSEGWRVMNLRPAAASPRYENQPYFLPGGDGFLYVAAAENRKTDIWRYTIDGAKKELLFSSPARSEFSPKLTPDGRALSYIQENEAGDVTRVHRRALDGVGAGEAVADFAPLGYYAWLDGGAALGVYYRSEPGSLHRVDVETGETEELHAAVGRALQADPAGAHLWFTEIVVPPGGEVVAGRDPETAQRLMRYDSATGDITALFMLPPGGQDFALLFDDDGAAEEVFSTDGADILYRDMEGDAGWTTARRPGAAPLAARAGAERPAPPLRRATRLAVSDDRAWIAVVQEAPGENQP